ncbi:MAG: carbon-nitrogen hydrolase family protein [Cyclobacteriaceae bacterium]
MKICLAQTKPHRGNIKKNIDDHLSLVRQAISKEADYLFFSELSLTGYEPELAKEIAISSDSLLLNDFQTLSDEGNISIGIGAPIKAENGIQIATIVFRPGQARFVYIKQHLHEDELPFFIPGEASDGMLDNQIALAICYELSIPEHAEKASECGAKIYIASVAKTKSNVEQASLTLSDIAKKHSMVVLMANCVGESGDGLCVGQSAIWDENGMLIAQLGDEEALLVFDTNRNSVGVIN